MEFYSNAAERHSPRLSWGEHAHDVLLFCWLLALLASSSACT